MKYLKLFENFDKSEIDKICKKYKIKNYTINPDGSIDVDGNVNLGNKFLTKLPIKFNKVSGWFDCSWNELTSLEGCPKEVGRHFYCYDNKLTCLIGGPNIVNSFNCNRNNLISLEGFPIEVGKYFYFDDNPIKRIVKLFDEDVNIYLEYQETYNFLRKDGKIVKHLLEEALMDFNEYYNKKIKLPKEIKGYTYL
jgi:hypothetical protein